MRPPSVRPGGALISRVRLFEPPLPHLHSSESNSPVKNPIRVGPLLGYETSDLYTVCILLDAGAPPPVLHVPSLALLQAFKKIADVGSQEFWRAEFPFPPPDAGVTVRYEIQADGVALADPYDRVGWQFYVPGKTEEPLLAYASCNGFSSFKLLRDTDQPYRLWEKLKEQHEAAPFALLLMGGDQVYADEIWESKRCPSLRDWSELNWDQQNKAKATVKMKQEIAAFYDWLYTDRWSDENMSLVLASIPSLMMWDDHDIFDGWGSYPQERHDSEVFQEAFRQAARLYDLFQQRGSTTNRLKADANHRSFGLRFRNYTILALDNRSERTIERIMSNEHWQDVKDWLAQQSTQGNANLLVLTGVPAVYRSFAAVEAAMDTTPWHEELEDDVHDHWSSRTHLAERMRLVMVLLNFLELPSQAKCKAILLSGDVHVGALGQIWNAHKRIGLTQLISSGIVHPPPSAFAWAGIQMMTSDTPEGLGDGEVTTEMLTPFGSPRYLRTRNYLTLKSGTDQKLWVNWVCENEKLKPTFAIASS